MFSQDPLVGMKCRGDPRVAGQPGLDRGMFVGGVVVAHEVQLRLGAGLGDLFEEAQELLVAMPGVAGVGDLAGGDLQRGEQRGDAVAEVVIGLALRDARSHRQLRRRCQIVCVQDQ
jgi:hypothetical protein